MWLLPPHASSVPVGDPKGLPASSELWAGHGKTHPSRAGRSSYATATGESLLSTGACAQERSPCLPCRSARDLPRNPCRCQGGGGTSRRHSVPCFPMSQHLEPLPPCLRPRSHALAHPSHRPCDPNPQPLCSHGPLGQISLSW